MSIVTYSSYASPWNDPIADQMADAGPPSCNGKAMAAARSEGDFVRKRTRLGGADFDAITEYQTCNRVIKALYEGRGGIIITANLDHLVRCKRSSRYRSIVKQADLVVADGMPVIWASHLQGAPLPQRVAGSNLCFSLACALAEHERSLFLLGGNPKVAEEAALVLKQRFPKLRVAGTYCPEMGFEQQVESITFIRDLLRKANPDMIYVALGCPKQEILIDQLRKDFPNAWWMGVGISLSFITGDVRRAPRWIQRLGFEWLYRLTQEPKRLAKRYIVDGIPFGLQLLTVSAVRGLRQKVSILLTRKRLKH